MPHTPSGFDIEVYFLATIFITYVFNTHIVTFSNDDITDRKCSLVYIVISTTQRLCTVAPPGQTLTGGASLFTVDTMETDISHMLQV